MRQAAHKIFDKPDILTAIQREGIILKRRGRAFWATCPLHDEKTPSFKIDPERQTFYCFGCHKKGDVVTLVMELHRFNFKEARSYLGIKGVREMPNHAYFAELKERKNLVAAFRQWEAKTRNEIALALRLYRQREAAGFSWEEALALADVLQDIPYLEWLYDEVFCKNDDEAKLQIFKEEYGI